ncbi:MAG: outer membrane lipoprotein-sorting protein [Verrucomicrobiota bacterium]
MMKRVTFLMAAMLTVAGGISEGQVGQGHIQTLIYAEQARGDLGRQGLEWEVAASSEEKGEKRSTALRVSAQNSKILAEVLAPEDSVGTKYLVAGDKMWMHKPNMSRPLSISKRQRVSGNAAVGDIAAISYLNDYSPEAVEDGEVDGEACWVFTLKKRTSAASYDTIRYFVSKANKLGLRAEFYTSSGKLLRAATMKYGNRVNINGSNRPFISEMTVEELLGSEKVSTLRYENFELREFPEATFSEDSLKR